MGKRRDTSDYERRDSGMNMKYFEYEHLPEKLQTVSKPFCELAREVAERNTFSKDPDEVEMCLRKLLEAKDCAVRARL